MLLTKSSVCAKLLFYQVNLAKGDSMEDFTKFTSHYHRNIKAQAEARKARDIHMARTDPLGAGRGAFNSFIFMGIAAVAVVLIWWLT